MATTIKLYHANEMIFRDSLFYRGEGKIFDKTRALKEFPENYVIVGEFRVNDGAILDMLEVVYEQTQNIDKPWNCKNPCRSTSVGDIAVIEDCLYIVASFGFERL